MRFNNVTTINNGTFDSQGPFIQAQEWVPDFLIQRWDNLADIVGQSTGSGMPLTAPSATGDIGVTNVPADISILEMNGVEYVVGRPNKISTLMLMDTRDMSALALDTSSSVSREMELSGRCPMVVATALMRARRTFPKQRRGLWAL